MAMNIDQERAEFEAWIASPPYEKPLGINPEASGFPGQYRAYEVQLAWEAYQAGRSANEADRRRRGNNQEPFGYFRATPFGWEDCAPTDDGAMALYESPRKSIDSE